MAYNTAMAGSSKSRKGYFILAAALLFAVSAPLRAASRPKCSYCGRSITGKYYRIEVGRRMLNICEPCHRTSPRCGLCRVPLRKPKGWNGRKELFCPKCFKTRLVCAICKKTIKGEYIKNSDVDETYCEKCYAGAHKCTSCQKPLTKDEQTTVHGKRICSYCNEKLPKCDRCSLTIVGPQISYRFADGLFCSHCDDNCLHCYVCAVPLGEEQLKLSDDRIMCPECSRSAVLSMATLRMIHDRAAGFLRRKLDMDIQHDYDLELARRRSQLGGEGHEIHGKEQGLFSNVGGESRILILEGATEAMCYETVAHEYAHAWHFEHGMENANQEIREGFAQWVASKTVEHFGFTRALKRLQTRTDQDYGTGYQKFAAVEKKKGVKGVFEFLAEKSRKR